MIDEVSIHTQLESELLAALVHATQTVGAGVHADVAAACIYDPPPHTPTCYVSAGRLGLRSAEEQSLEQWPHDADGLLEFVRTRGERDTAFRVRQLMDELTYARQRFFRRVEAFTSVSDAVCVTWSIPDDTPWCALVLLRCGDHSPFPDTLLPALDRLRPVLARAIRKGLQRETQPRGYELSRPSPGVLVNQPVSTSRLLAKLSRTELHVLNHLRSEMTERRIADEIGRSPHTVHVHVKNIYRKLGVSSRKDLLELFSDN